MRIDYYLLSLLFDTGPRWNGQVLVEFSSRQKAASITSSTHGTVSNSGSGASVVEPGLRVKAAILWLYVSVNQQQTTTSSNNNNNNNKRPLANSQGQQPRSPTLYIFRVITVPSMSSSSTMQPTADNTTTTTQNLVLNK